MKELYECVCQVCSEPFYSEDEEALYCDKCWEELMADFFYAIRKEWFDV